MGSNAFGIEEVDGRRQHAIDRYLDLVLDGRVDITPMLTHLRPLSDWREAFDLAAGENTEAEIPINRSMLNLRLDGAWVREDLPVEYVMGFDAAATRPI